VVLTLMNSHLHLHLHHGRLIKRVSN